MVMVRTVRRLEGDRKTVPRMASEDDEMTDEDEVTNRTGTLVRVAKQRSWWSSKSECLCWRWAILDILVIASSGLPRLQKDVECVAIHN